MDSKELKATFGFWEFGIQNPIKDVDMVTALDKYFIDIKPIITDTNSLWERLADKPGEEVLCFTMHISGSINVRFRTYLELTLNLRELFPDRASLRFAGYLSVEFGCDVIMGDYTSKCEFLLITSDRKVYFTDAAENDESDIEINRLLSKGEPVEDFINKYS